MPFLPFFLPPRPFPLPPSPRSPLLHPLSPPPCTYPSRVPIRLSLPSSSTRPPSPPSTPSSPSPFAKLTISLSILVTLSLSALFYSRLNRFTYKLLHNSTKTHLQRDLSIGRVVRFNPFTGIKLRNVRLLPSATQPTAPVISASSVSMSLSGHLGILIGRPLKLNVRVHGANVRVMQKVIQDAKGEPMGLWDPGLQSTPDEGRVPDFLRTFLKYVQPGSLTVNNALVSLCPADFVPYGHGSELIDVKKAGGKMTFPAITVAEDGHVLLDGNVQGIVKGTPVEGGNIEVELDMDASKLRHLKKEDVMLNLKVRGDGVKAGRVAAFLNLPFRANEGICGGDIDMEFLYKSDSLVPIMRGEASLDGVALRFHPDPKTPEFAGVEGKLRFDGKTLFLDGPAGKLGTIPMTVVGGIHLEDGYQLMGYVGRVDVNEIIETFQVDKFVPVQGYVEGEVQMAGELEEPIIRGIAQSVSENNIFDRTPVEKANVAFEWDAVAGTLIFSEINAKVKGGGNVQGSGGLYFDMTKESPFDSGQDIHHVRSPKARYWNPAQVGYQMNLAGPPKDVFEIDENAPSRPYDSMHFEFKATDINGADLILHYGGEYGKAATKAMGLISGEAVLAGHAKDANCKAIWRTTSPPPAVKLSPDSQAESSKSDNLSLETTSKGKSSEEGELPTVEDTLPNTDVEIAESNTQYERSNPSDMLGGGDFYGLVYIKLGDLPDARRIRARTEVKNFDMRRAGWTDPIMRRFLANAPLLNVSADTFFEGTTSQTPILPLDTLKISRTPRMELLGADGALAVKGLSINNVKFNKVLNGSFSFTVSDFALSLKEVNAGSPKTASAKTTKGTVSSAETEPESGDELSISASSTRGDGNVCFRLKEAEVVGSISQDQRKHQIANVSTRNLCIEDFIGDDLYFSSGETLGGSLNMDMRLDLTLREGEGSLDLSSPRIGPLNFSSVIGNLVWHDREVVLDSGVVKYRQSEYQIDASYKSKSENGPEFEWEVNVNIPKASIEDVASLVQAGNAVATAMQSSNDRTLVSLQYSGGPAWIQKLAESKGSERRKSVYTWRVPQHLSLEDQAKWFNQYCHDKDNIARLSESRALERALMDFAPTDVQGDLSGNVTFKYNSRKGETRRPPSNANTILQAILDQMARTSFSFQLGGRDWRVGPAMVDRVEASGTFEDGILLLGPLSLSGKDGFGAEGEGRISSSGDVKASAVLRQAPAALVNEFSRAPVNVTGECNGRVEIEGNLSNPRAFGRIVWTDATLNGKQVHGAKTDMACINGRCILNVNARIGGRQKEKEQESDEANIRSLQWGESVIAGLRDLASQVASRGDEAEIAPTRASRRGAPEEVRVQISAPVRFYLLKYLQKRAPTSFWAAVEPVLGGSLPSDDEWILMDVNVKKYGLVLLNTVLPELGWESGNSDIKLRVTGTLADPIIKGSISVSDGIASPPLVSKQVQALRGAIEFSEDGLISMKSISARSGGRTMNLNGDLFFSNMHVKRLTFEQVGAETVLERLKPKDASGRKKRRKVVQRLNEVKQLLQRGKKGLTFDLGGIEVTIPDMIVSNLSGRLHVTGTSMKPTIAGGVTLSDGVISLGNVASRTSEANASLNAGIDMFQGKEISEDSPSPELADDSDLEKFDKDTDLDSVASSTVSEGVLNGITTTKTKLEKTSSETVRNEVREQEMENELYSGFAGLHLDKLRVTLGREMQVVQPFVLNFETQGVLTVDGEGSDPQVQGELRVMRGSVNMLATRMSVRRDGKNYVRFVEKSLGDEPLVQMTLEDRDLTIRVGECGVSQWADHVSIVDKQGEELGEQSLGKFVDEQLESMVTSPKQIAKVLAGYIVNSVRIGGKWGKLEWNLFPTMVGGKGNTEELGVGGGVEVGGMRYERVVGVGGNTGGRLKFRKAGVEVDIDAEGERLERHVKIEIPEWWKRKRKRRDYQKKTKTEVNEMKEERGRQQKPSRSDGIEKSAVQ